MVTFIVGDKVTIAASIRDLCGAINIYYVYDINCALTDPVIRTQPFLCLPAAGVSIEFNWSNATGSENKATCKSLMKYLGTATTNSLGVASLEYTITQNDLDLFTNNLDYFDLMVCIRNTNISSLHFSDVRRDFQPDKIQINSNPCLNVPCPDKCFGPDMWGMKCDPLTGLCVQDVRKEQNSVLCTATHRIDFDFSFADQSVKDIIFQNILSFSNQLAQYLPYSPDITYVGTDYYNGKIRVYIKPTNPLPVNMYMQQLGLLETVVGWASAIAGIIAVIFGIFIAGAGAPLWATLGVLVIGASGIAAAYTILTSGETATITPGTKTEFETVNDIEPVFDQGVEICKYNYPCALSTPNTCNMDQMKGYLTCIKLGEYLKWGVTAKISGKYSQAEMDDMEARLNERNDKLEQGLMTTQEALDDAKADTAELQAKYDALKASMECPGQVYDPNQQKCVDISGDCWIPNPVGGCILTAKTGKTVALIGGLLFGGYLLFSLSKRG